MKSLSFAGLVAFTPLLLLAQSNPFTYVDATLANSTLNGAPFTLATPANYDATDPEGDDGLWSYRTTPSSFEGGDHFETDSGRPSLGAENDHESLADIITSITIPTAGTYRIVAVFQSNNNRDIAARIGTSPGLSDIFTGANSLNLDQSAANPDIIFDSSYSNGRDGSAGGADLGTVTTTTDNETIQIHVNGLTPLSLNRQTLPPRENILKITMTTNRHPRPLELGRL